MFLEEQVPNERLRHARHLKGWTQSKLAEALDTDPETVSRWERGISVPSAYFREKLCRVLDMTPAELGLIPDLTEPHIPSATPCVFLAAAYVDTEREFTTRLKAHLRARDVTVLSSRAIRRQGVDNQRKALQEAIRTVQAVLLIVSPETRSSRQVLNALQLAGMYRRPICAVWIDGESWQESVPVGSAEPFATIDVRKRTDQQVFEHIVATLEEQWFTSNETAVSLETTKESTQSPLEPRNPYKGLRAFRSEDRRDFFGRELLIGELVEQVKSLLAVEHSDTSRRRLLTVIGASGSGKSSVVMAGLLPRLQCGALGGSEQWLYLEPMIPGTHPLEALALTLAPRLPSRSVKSICEDLEDESARGLHLLAKRLVTAPGQQVVLLVDQFEELFTQTPSEEERQHFIDLLVTAARERKGSLISILTLRADFYDRPLEYPELSQLMLGHQVVVLPMGVQDLRAVIEGPAALPDVRLSFESTLVGDMLFEVQGQAGALPLLEFVLERLCEMRSDHRLTLSAYRELGGVKGALSQHAERTYAALPSEDHRKLAQALFARLIDPGATEQDTTRRRAELAEFSLADETATRLLRETADAFITARLLTTNEAAGATTLEVSHEAVIREWRRLAEWIREAREDLHLLQVIRADAAEWQRYERSPDRLYRGTQLAEALAWQERWLLSCDEEAFLQASASEQERQEALAAERQRQEAWQRNSYRTLMAELEARESSQRQKAWQRKRYTRRAVLVGLVGLGMTATAGIIIHGGLRSNLSSLPLSSSYQGHTAAVYSVAWSPDGTRLASASADYTVRVWDASTGQSALSYHGHRAAVGSVAWSPDGTRLASASDDHSVQVWDATSGQTLGQTLLTYRRHTAAVTCVAWSPNGTRLASASADQTVQVWDASTGQSDLSYRGHTAAVGSVAWSPDGMRLASGSIDHTVQVWDATSGQILRAYHGHMSAVTCVAWSPDGKRLASASADQTVQVWDASTGRILHTYTEQDGQVAWSPDGRRLASASIDHTVQVWDATNGQILRTYARQAGPVNSIAWSPDGRYLASGSIDHTVQVWDAILNRGSTVFIFSRHSAEVASIAWSPDGRRLASASIDLITWDATSGQILRTYRGHADYVRSVAWSPDGKRLASGSYDHTVQVWDVTSGTRLFTYTGHTDAVYSVVWSPDGKRLASGSTDHTVQVWDATSGQILRTYRGHTDYVRSVAWSPDGRYLASASADKTVQVWDATSGTRLLTYTGHTDAVTSVAWSPDGRRLASGSIDRTVQVWDASSGHLLLTYTGPDYVRSVAWSPDGKRLALANFDHTVQVWDVNSVQILLTYRRHTGPVASVAWSPSGDLIASASYDTTVHVWLWLQS